MSLLVLLRHGQALPQSYAGHEHGGDAGLSALGRRQAAILGQSLLQRGVRPDRVVTGGLRRQAETAEVCLAAMGCAGSRARVDERWQEYDVEPLMAAYPPGDVPGDPAANPRAFQRFLDRSLKAWMADEHPPPGLQPWSSFAAAAPAALAVEADAATGTTLVFTSAGPIAAVAADLLGLGPDAFLALHRIVVNSSLTKIISGSRGRHLLTFNDHSHLETSGKSSDERLLTYR